MITLTKEDAFTIVDIISKAQEVIRCKDCKHSIPDREDGKIVGYECDLHYDSYWDADDFCSNGVKKDE